MNDGQEYASSKNPMMVTVWILLVAAAIWAIVATSMAFNRGKDLAQTRQTLERVKADAEQAALNMQAREAELERKAQEADQLRKIALDWKNQYQAKLVALEKEKPKAVAATEKKSTSSSKSTKKSSSKKSTSSSSKKR